VAAEGYSCRKTQWVFLRSRLPRKKVNALSYQPTSPTLSDVDCGVVATYTHRHFMVVLKWGWDGERDMQAWDGWGKDALELGEYC